MAGKDVSAQSSKHSHLPTVDGEMAGTRLVHKVSKVAVDPSFTEMMVKTDAFDSRAIRFCKRKEFGETMEVTEEIGKVRVPTRILKRRLHG